MKTERADFDDKPTFEMLTRGESVGVFQLESQGMRDLMKKVRPDHINDLIALVALYRPGPMDSIPKYIACKHGREKPDYLHPMLEPILKETFGVMTYQEDVMRIARELAGYTMGEADLLRRAMGKKIPSEMAKQREMFLKGAAARSIPDHIAEQIFEQAAKFAGYGFNKGHAAAYAQVAYQTAYLKANYPVEFLAASMTLDIGNTDRLNVFRQEAARLSIEVRAPDINRSHAHFACDAGNAERSQGGVIYYALAAVKNVGRQAMDHVVAVREADGPFRSIADFARRIDPRLVNKRAFESLVKAGAFDALHKNRRQLVQSADIILSSAARTVRDREEGQSSLFGASDSDARQPSAARRRRLADARTLVGRVLRHRLLSLRPSARCLCEGAEAPRRDGLRRSPGRRAPHLGQGDRGRDRDPPSGTPRPQWRPVRLCRPLRSNGDVRGHAVLRGPEPGARGPRSRPLGRHARGRRLDDDELKLRALGVEDLNAAAADAGEGLKIRLSDPAPLPSIAARLKQSGKGLVTVIVPVEAHNQDVEIVLPKRVQVTPELKSVIASLGGVVDVETV